MDKEDVECIFTILISHEKNEILPFVTWMDIESIMLNEISQKKKDKYHMISLIFEILKTKQMYIRDKAETDSYIQKNKLLFTRWGKSLESDAIGKGD